jgi:protein-S-isoprenylcysteine O-methyltransferase Ste14
MGATALATIVLGASVLVLLLIFSIAVPGLRVWPLPDAPGSALRLRRGVNRVSGLLMPALSAAVFVLAIVERETFPVSSIGLTAFGATAFLAGGVFGLLGYFQLGPALSHDQRGPLVSAGPYRISRNPQYVGAVAVLLGFSTALGSIQALFAALACSAWYLLAPLAEESWLREKYGPSYEAYVASAPRYLGLPRQRRAV